jgi:hypothetical protein
MMITISSYYRRARRIARRLLTDPRLRLPLRISACLLAGFVLSAASLGNHAQPLVLALICAGIGGWMPALIALGAAAGYWAFWGQAGLQGIVRTAIGLPLCVAVGKTRISRQSSLFMPALAALTVALTGLVFQAWWRDDTTVWMYLLRIVFAFGGTWLLSEALQRKDPMAQWAAGALGVLALAQIGPLPFLNLGFLAAGTAAVLLPFPAVAMVGLALDLSQVTAVPMTEGQKEKLAAKLAGITGKQIELTNTIDPSCIGGVRLDYDGKRVDDTIIHRLDAVSSMLKNTIL